MRIQLERNDVGLGISLGKDPRLAPRGGATVQDSRAPTHKQSDQLRGFILNCDSPLGESTSRANIAGPNPPCRSQQLARSEIDAVLLQFGYRFRISQTNRGLRSLLVVAADFPRTIKAELAHPALYQPKRMRQFLRQLRGAFRRYRLNFVIWSRAVRRTSRRQLAQHGICKGHR